jgi:glycosyltransferase involved in cell wall biosynthesis
VTVAQRLNIPPAPESQIRETTGVGEDRSAAALVLASRAPYPPTGGAEKRTLRLLEAMQRAGARPHLLLTESVTPAVAEALATRAIEVDVTDLAPPTLLTRARQHLHRRPSPYRARLAERLSSLVAEREPAFVQFEHTQNAYYFDAVGDTPVVLSLHNVDSDMIETLARAQPVLSLARLRLENRRRAMLRTERRAAAAANAMLCVSHQDLERFRPLARRGLVVPNGVDEELFTIDASLPDDELVLFVGKFDYEPNRLGATRFLREGWPLVTRRRPTARLRLVGPAMPDDLDQLVREDEHVDAVGEVTDMFAELSTATVVVIPIWHGGGTRLKALEALAAARPVAGTPLGVSGIGFVGGRDGLLGESPLELGEAVSTLLSDRELASRLAAAGRRLAEPYRWPLAMAPAEKLYRELLSITDD